MSNGRRTLEFCALLVIALQPANALKSQGHAAATQAAAAKSGFSAEATELLTRGAVEADALDWNDPRVHAQTPNDDDGDPTQSAEQAKAGTTGYLRSKCGLLRDELSRGNISNALYLLGYVLHTFQDLAAHRGMTNFDHSFLSYKASKNPDENPGSISLANQWTMEIFAVVRSNVGLCAWERLRTFKRPTHPSDNTYAARVVGVPPLHDLWHYRGLKNLDPKAYRFAAWDRETVYATLKDTFISAFGGKRDDLPWLLEGTWDGNWAHNGYALITLSRDSVAFQLQLKVAQGEPYTWPMTREGFVLTGKLLLGAKLMLKDRAPQPVVEKMAVVAAKYLTLKFSPETCKIDAFYEQDQVWWESDRKTGKYTGRSGLNPRSPKYADRAQFEWKGVMH